MREILFKARTTKKHNEKHAFDNVWVEGDLIRSGGKYYIHTTGNKVNVDEELGKIIVMHEIDQTTLCQYTGLVDKNGQKIWENDILRIGENEKLMVSWHHFKASWVLSKKGWMYNHFFGESVEPEDVEVVGNIFDGGLNDGKETEEN
ncbi:YopX family protein [Faecalimonas sp. LCP19S3_D12]